MTNHSFTDAQLSVAKAFFELPESNGFAIAGGAALIALGLSSRPTQDLDIFTTPPAETVTAAFKAFSQAANRHGWGVEATTTEASFCRFAVLVGDEQVLMDLAIESPFVDPPTLTILGPTLSANEMAARKLLALFDRAAVRDFVDVFTLAKRFEKNDILRRAA